MNAEQTSVASAAREIFERIKESLESSHLNEFVAVEPVSGLYFLGATLSEAIGEARLVHPDRLAHAFRIGHPATVHLGMSIR